MGLGSSHLQISDMIWLNQIREGSRWHLLLHPLHSVVSLLMLPAVLLKSTPRRRYFILMATATILKSHATWLNLDAHFGVFAILVIHQIKSATVTWCQCLHLHFALWDFIIIREFQLIAGTSFLILSLK